MFPWQQSNIIQNIWNGWSLYPVANLTYMPAAGHVLQFSLSSDKEYPEYWSVQNCYFLHGSLF